MDHYEVERSAEGTVFSRQNTTAAIGNSTVPVNYSWFDANPQTGNNYYRVKAIDKNGLTKYSAIVKVTIGKGEPAIVVYPNPVNGNTISLKLTNMDKGSYTVNLYNNLGQKVFGTTLQHSGGTATKTIVLEHIANGAYELLLTGENKVKMTKRIIKN